MTDWQPFGWAVLAYDEHGRSWPLSSRHHQDEERAVVALKAVIATWRRNPDCTVERHDDGSYRVFLTREGFGVFWSMTARIVELAVRPPAE